MATWHSAPDVVPRTEFQAVLDTIYERADEAVRRRTAQVAVPRRRRQTRRRPGTGEIDAWETAEDATVRETLEETGLTVEVVKFLGERVHPKTGRSMSYTACEVVSGEAHVADGDELAEVAWVTHAEIPEYVPYGLFEPVQEYLDGALGTAD